MRHFFLFVLLFLAYSLQGQSIPSLCIMYENTDAYNPLQRTPHLASYIMRKDGVELIRGTERSTLRLYEHAGIYTTDSVYIEFPGNDAKAWRYSIISIRDYVAGHKLSIYPNLPADFAYFEHCDETLKWNIDKTRKKRILGLECSYASVTIDKVLHQIWFTNALPYRDGPAHSRQKYHCNWPGLVLEHIMGDGNTTRAIDIRFIEPFADLKNRLKRIREWNKTPRPSYPPENPDSNGFLLITKELPIGSWIPLLYEAEGHEGWLSNQ
jgi:GLPGLI family protein